MSPSKKISLSEGLVMYMLTIGFLRVEYFYIYSVTPQPK